MHLIRTSRFHVVWLVWLTITGSVWSATEDILGDWMGRLDVPGVEIRIAFTIQEDQEGALSAELHVPNQVVFDIPFMRSTLRTIGSHWCLRPYRPPMRAS